MALAIILIGTTMVAAAETPADNIRIIDVKLDSTKLPSEATRVQAPVKELGDDWYMAEVRFTTLDDISEEVQVKFYVDGLDKLKNDAFVVLTGEQTFLNVPKGEHYAVMYLDPMSLARYGGKKEGARGFKKSNLHVEIVATDSAPVKKSKNEAAEKQDPNWFTQGQQLPGILIGVKDSPWWPFEARRYNRIKSKN